MDELKNNTNVTLLSKLKGKIKKSYVVEANQNGEADEGLKQSIKNIRLCGIVCTRDIMYNRPYYMVSYGVKNINDLLANVWNGKTTWIARNASREFLADSIVELISAVKEIEKFLDSEGAYSIEFGIDKDNRIIIFNVDTVEEIMAKVKPMSDREFIDTKAFAKCNYLDTNHIMSDMACMNVVKVLGNNPRYLDYSIYRELITSKVWNEALLTLGYEAVPDEIMFKVGNKPYISVNNVFMGLTPMGLGNRLLYKLDEYYSYKLRGNRAFHGVIEDNIIFTSYNFKTRDNISRLLDYDFQEKEVKIIEDSLYNMTVDIVNNYSSLINQEKDSIEELTRLTQAIIDEAPLLENNVMKLYKYVNELIEGIKEKGTPQLVRQQRCVAIGKSFCDSLVKMGYFTKDEMDTFLQSIETVKTKFEDDFDMLENGMLGIDDFLNLYGDIRLDIFDIRTECYRQVYTGSGISKDGKELMVDGKTVYLDESRLKDALVEDEVEIEPDVLRSFIVDSVVNLESFLLEVKKAIGLLLDIIIRMGDILGIAREDMSYLEIQDLLSYHSRDSYIQIIEMRRNMYHANRYLMLPEVIFDVGDIDVVDYSNVIPTYITDKKISAEVVCMDDDDISQDITGKIVVLANASSGYNWLFEKNIAGIVTKYGGEKTRLAARCNRYGIPAVLGCGEKIYQHVITMKQVEIDCQNKKIREFLN